MSDCRLDENMTNKTDDDRITKPEAAELLGVSEKAIERYTNANPPKLSKDTVNRPGGGFISYYSRKEVLALKKRQEQLATPQQTDIQTKRHTDTTPTKRQGDMEAFLAVVVEAVNGQQNKAFSLTELAVKSSLSMSEAVALSGCSEAHLLKGIEAGAIRSDFKGTHGKRRLSRVDVLRYAEEF